jgi:hypothetical protein
LLHLHIPRRIQKHDVDDNLGNVASEVLTGVVRNFFFDSVDFQDGVGSVVKHVHENNDSAQGEEEGHDHWEDHTHPKIFPLGHIAKQEVGTGHVERHDDYKSNNVEQNAELIHSVPLFSVLPHEIGRMVARVQEIVSLQATLDPSSLIHFLNEIFDAATAIVQNIMTGSKSRFSLIIPIPSLHYLAINSFSYRLKYA